MTLKFFGQHLTALSSVQLLSQSSLSWCIHLKLIFGLFQTGVSKSRYFVISISIKYSNFSRFYKKKGPFYQKFRCDKFCNCSVSTRGLFSIKHDLARSCFQFWLKIGDEGDKILRKKLARR